MKLKIKGFTLIELLAVIVILAIIALIAVPIILNIIDKANKNAFKDTAYGVISAGELYYAEQQLELNGMSEDKIFNLPDTTNTLGLKGEVPNGTMTVSKNGDISLALTNGRYCITKNYNDTDITITEDFETCEMPVTQVALGDEVYFNPETNSRCTDYVESNSQMGVKTGCMRWYVYKIENETIGLILDHNTTAVVEWISIEDYKSANIDNTECLSEACNDEGPITLMRQLEEDTKNWKVNADIIVLQDLLNLIPEYINLTDEEKVGWEDNYVMDIYLGSSLEAYNNIPITDDYKTEEEYMTVIYNYRKNNYGQYFLPSYMYEDLDTCTDEGICSTNYWTSTAYTSGSNSAWVVIINKFDYGYMNYEFVSDEVGVDSDGNPVEGDTGIRPVIETSKW